MKRLHDRLIDRGITSRILCDRDVPENCPEIELIPSRPRLDGIVRRLISPLGLNDIHRVSSSMVVEHPFFRDADVVHLHGLHSGFLSYLSLPALTRHKRVVWTLHDDWGMTGHCASPSPCTRWQNGCGRCPDLKRHPKVSRDSTHLEWKLKKWAYGRSQFTLVALSRQQLADVRRSILGRFDTVLIPNGIDTAIFSPRSKRQSQERFGLPSDKVIIAFAALTLNAPLKGADLLVKAINALDECVRSKVHLLLVGRDGADIAQTVSVPTTLLGPLDDLDAMAAAYSAGDVFVSPTRSETFGLVIAESMACATPAVAYAVGGVPSVIEHGVDGLLVEPESVHGLAKALWQVIEDAALRHSMSLAARNAATTKFSDQRTTDDYLSLYRSLAGKEAVDGGVDVAETSMQNGKVPMSA